ncbi:U-box domain-containing protein 35-like isoform X2 [Salvia miltiorrhiza]|uniref:U-box domain-containing protein 35-like isoform X2 n=1 Tax=Salvia miltiorrhiza TaxID=226208 RepID=UPI0025ABDD7F|nr:U-box domain-containing protein 35-like isoform X2 [Salvia miltiorrhiza]
MWLPNGKASSRGRKGGRNGLVAVAIDTDKASRHAIQWAIENLLAKGQTVILIHVLQRSSANSCCNYALTGINGSGSDIVLEKPTRDLFLTFHCFCTRKDILCFDVVLEDMDIAKAITEYTAHAAIENLVLGASRHGFIRRLKTVDVPTSVSKSSPEFCTVYVISKTKLSSVRNASRQAPFASPLLPHLQQLQEQSNNNNNSNNNAVISPTARTTPRHLPSKGPDRTPPRKVIAEDTDMMSKSPILTRGYNPNMFMDLSDNDTDISFISSERPSTDSRFMDPLLYDGMDPSRSSRVSVSSESSFGSMRSGPRYNEMSSFSEYSTASMENDEVEAEMRRLKLELQKTMDMYSTACKEALTAKQKAVELHRWRVDEEKRLEEARTAEEAARVTAEQEKARYKTALENVEAAHRVAELESQRRVEAEKRSMQDGDENGLIMTPLRYRRYSIEEIEEATDYFHESRKIGEGGYGPVYKCSLDHTPVAVKVLRPDAAQGRSQFQQEVEVLSCLRHPNMVLLLGACPEYGCLVYEYMANGSLEDRLHRRGNTRPLTWQLRYRIAAEIATGLHFLHQTKPEPLVHRDLKPGNILLDQNYVSKISDVGLARLVPPSVADDVTQYRMTSTAGTFCYIDPEYQQTGMLGVKSDVYSLGIVLLQIITAKPAMGLTHHIGNAIEKGTLPQMLDPTVPDWPMEETLNYAKLALQCAELRRKDRPDLGKIIVPELNKLRELGEDNMCNFLIGGSTASTPNHSFISSSSKSSHEFKSDPNVQSTYSGIDSGMGSTSMPGHVSGIAQDKMS